MNQTRLALVTLVLAFSIIIIACKTSTPSPQEMPMPQAQHNELLKSVGTWTGTLTSFMADAPAEPVAATETVVAVGGFWTQARFECNFGGLAYVGTGVVGYSTSKKKYVGTWVDAFSSELAVMEGDYNEKTKITTMRWNTIDPATGKPVPNRMEIARQENSYTSTFYMGEGQGTKVMVIAMKRQLKPKTTR